MKIHTRTLFIIGMTVSILIIGMIFLAQFFILQSYARIEQKDSIVNVERVISQIQYEENNLGENARDWAVWDDTYRFMTDGDPVYVTSNLDQVSSYESIQVNGILYYKNSGDYLYGRWYNLHNRTETNVPQGILDYFLSHSNLVMNKSVGAAQQGFILQPEGIYMASLHQVQNSSGEGPSPGTIILVRYYDDPRVSALQDRVHIPVKMIPLDEQWFISDPVVLQLTAPDAPAVVTRVHNQTTLLSNTLIKDIENKPIALLKVTTSRDVYQQAMATVSFYLITFIIIAIVFGAVSELLLRRYIVKPLSDLDSLMKEIGKKHDLSERLSVNGDDEIASLKRSLNTMLQEIQDSQMQLALQREQLAEANRKANLYLDIYLDVLTYEIMNAFFSLNGYTDILKNTVGEKEKGYTLRMIETLKKSRYVIQNIETISKIYKHPPEQKPVNLQNVIEKEMAANRNFSIHLRNTNVMILADEMLQVVFQNLFSNSIKYGGPAVVIDVNVDEQPDGVFLISVSDTGKGITDEMKPGIFDRFLKDSHKRSSYGLGLHIVKMLIEAYGGRVWADDRVKGHPEQGAAIRFTLHKA